MPATATAAKATGTIELEKRSRMTISSPAYNRGLLRRIPSTPTKSVHQGGAHPPSVVIIVGRTATVQRIGSRLRRPDSATPLTRYPQPSAPVVGRTSLVFMREERQ